MALQGAALAAAAGYGVVSGDAKSLGEVSARLKPCRVIDPPGGCICMQRDAITEGSRALRLGPPELSC